MTRTLDAATMRAIISNLDFADEMMCKEGSSGGAYAAAAILYIRKVKTQLLRFAVVDVEVEAAMEVAP